MKTTLENIATFSKQLQTLLEQEYEILNQQDYEALISLSSQKQQLLQQLDLLDQQRQKLSSGHSSFGDYIRQQTDADILESSWQQIQGKLKFCRQQNEINGRLLQKKQEISTELLGLLSGHQHSTPATYGPDGLQQNGNSILAETQV